MSRGVRTRALDDRLLRRIPAEWPPTFCRLPFEEQRWRGRVFLVTYLLVDGQRSGGRTAFAWSVALGQDPAACAENRRFVEELGDEMIEMSLDAAS